MGDPEDWVDKSEILRSLPKCQTTSQEGYFLFNITLYKLFTKEGTTD